MKKFVDKQQQEKSEVINQKHGVMINNVMSPPPQEKYANKKH